MSDIAIQRRNIRTGLHHTYLPVDDAELSALVLALDAPVSTERKQRRWSWR